MAYHLYVTPSGEPSVLDTKMHPAMAGDFTYLGEFGEEPKLHGTRYVNGQWVPMDGWQELRRRAYPSITDQLDALWRAMDQGVLPKVEGFYDKIADVKKRFPKP